MRLTDARYPTLLPVRLKPCRLSHLEPTLTRYRPSPEKLIAGGQELVALEGNLGSTI